MINALTPIFPYEWIKKNLAIILGILLFSIAMCMQCPLSLLAGMGLLFCILLTLFTFPLWGILCAIFLIPLTRIPGLTTYIEPLRFCLFFVILGIWLLRWDIKTIKRFSQNPYNILFGIFTFFLLLHCLVAPDITRALRIAYLHILCFCFYYLFCDVFKDTKYLKKALCIYLSMGIGIAALAILQYMVLQWKLFPFLARIILPPFQRYILFFAPEQLFVLGSHRSLGILFHPNVLGFYLAILFPLICVFILYTQSIFFRIIFFAAGLVVIAGIFASGSRGALLNIATSSLVLLYSARKQIPWWIIGTAMVFFVSILGIFFHQLIPYLRMEHILSSRDVIWQNSITLFGEHPFWGQGIGTFIPEYFSRFGFSGIADAQTALIELAITGETPMLAGGFHAHNLFLHYAAEMGIIGVLLIFSFYYLFLRECIVFLQHHKDHLDPFDKKLIIGILASILGQCVHNFFDMGIFYENSLGLSLILIVSMGIALMQKYTDTSFAHAYTRDVSP